MASRTVCISHRKDVDGLASAALVMKAKDANVFFASYGDLVDKLKMIKDVDEVYICDLGMSPKIAEDFVSEVSRISKSSRVTYIDHHPLAPSLKERIESKGVEVFHSTEECAGVLTFMKLKDKLPDDVFLLACYAAVTDYLDNQPVAKKLIQRFDRQFILYEATMLSYAISRKNSDDAFLQRVVACLSNGDHPHRIKDVEKYAVEQAEVISNIALTLRKEGKRMTTLSYARTVEDATGLVANLLLGAFDTPVAFAYKLEKDGMLEGSLRAIYTYSKHLGSIASPLSEKLGGSGGGHMKAAGVRLPASRLQEFLQLLDKELQER